MVIGRTLAMEVFATENLKGIHYVQWNVLIYTDHYFQ